MVGRCVDMSKMVMCNARVIMEYDRRRSGLPSAPLHRKCDNNNAEHSTDIALNINRRRLI